MWELLFQIVKIYNVAGGVKKGHNLKQNLMIFFKYSKETLVQIEECKVWCKNGGEMLRKGIGGKQVSFLFHKSECKFHLNSLLLRMYEFYYNVQLY